MLVLYAAEESLGPPRHQGLVVTARSVPPIAMPLGMWRIQGTHGILTDRCVPPLVQCSGLQPMAPQLFQSYNSQQTLTPEEAFPKKHITFQLKNNYNDTQCFKVKKGIITPLKPFKTCTIDVEW